MNKESRLAALQKCKEDQQKNARVMQERLDEITNKYPDIAKLLHQRKKAILDGLQGALNGIAPQSLVEDTERRNQQIKTLLGQYGYCDTYLEPIYTCPLCEDTGFVGEHKKTFCSCVINRSRQIFAEGLYLANNEQSFETYDENVYDTAPMQQLGVSQRAYMQVLKNKCEQYADSLPNTPQRNLLFYGNSGLGKTFLLQSVAKRAQQRGIATLCLTANTLLNQIRKAYFSQAEDNMALFYTIDLLLIDDLGTEPIWENITVEQLFALIDARLTAKKHTVISTNLSLTQLQARYTERIASRLLDTRNNLAMHFLGQDVRKR